MSDKIVQTLTGRIFKEPTTTEKAIRVEVVSNLYDRQQDGSAGSHPLYTTIILTGGLMKLWAGRMGELVKGARVSVTGDWNFSLFQKRDNTPGFSGSLFPLIFEVNPPRSQSTGTTEAAPAAAAAATTQGPKEDDLPF